jgi:glycosyltransferase involved in cell wall biosynthesis
VASGGYILFLGRLSPEKNCHLLIEAFTKIETSAKLGLAGGSGYSDYYLKQLRRLANERVRFLDWVSGDSFEELLTNSMLFVLPSDVEGLSLALLDAMGAGLCVLAGDIPENSEAIEGAGFTFQHGNPHDLERMLRLWISNPHLRHAAAVKARARVGEHDAWEPITRQLEDIYMALLSDGKLPVHASVISKEEIRAHRHAASKALYFSTD